MKIGTKVKGQFIADSRFLGNCANIETMIAVKRDSMKALLYGSGLEVYSYGDERLLDNWGDGTAQIRQSFELILSKKLTKNDIYILINQVEAQPLKFQ